MYLILFLTRNRQSYLKNFINSLNNNLHHGSYDILIGDDNTTEFNIEDEIKLLKQPYTLLKSDRKLGARENLLRCINHIDKEYEGILFFESDALLCKSALNIMQVVGKYFEKDIDNIVDKCRLNKINDFSVTFTYTELLRIYMPNTIWDFNYNNINYPFAYEFSGHCSVSAYLPFKAINRIKKNAENQKNVNKDYLDALILFEAHTFRSKKSLVLHQGVDKRTVYTDANSMDSDSQTKKLNLTLNWVGADY